MVLSSPNDARCEEAGRRTESLSFESKRPRRACYPLDPCSDFDAVDTELRYLSLMSAEGGQLLLI